MVYITDQNSAQLRAHIRNLQKHPGWSDAVTDRLFKEIVAQDETIKTLRSRLSYMEERHGKINWDAPQSSTAGQSS